MTKPSRAPVDLIEAYMMQSYPWLEQIMSNFDVALPIHRKHLEAAGFEPIHVEMELASRLDELLGDRIAAQATRVDAELEKISQRIDQDRRSRLSEIPGLPAALLA